VAELKTRANNASVNEFLGRIADRQKRADCKAIARMMREATGKRAKMWGTSIVGYDRYDCTYASGHSGSSMIVGFSPRARNIAVYIMPGFGKFESLMMKLGKYKASKSCLYIAKLADVEETILARLIQDSVGVMRRRYKKWQGAGRNQ
jgi:hypothetical protein